MSHRSGEKKRGVNQFDNNFVFPLLSAWRIGRRNRRNVIFEERVMFLSFPRKVWGMSLPLKRRRNKGEEGLGTKYHIHYFLAT